MFDCMIGKYGERTDCTFISILFYINHHRSAEDVRSIYKLSSRFRAVVSDMASVQKHDPFAKFVIFSQYKESLTAFKAVTEGINDHLRESEAVWGDTFTRFVHRYFIIDIHLRILQKFTFETCFLQSYLLSKRFCLRPFPYEFNSVIIDSTTGNAVEKTRCLAKFNEDPSCNICLLTTGR